MQIPTLGSHSASLATGVIGSFSKGAGSSGAETGIYFHRAAAAQTLLSKLCIQHGIFRKSLPGQLLTFHLHLLVTFLTFHLLQALGVGRCLFPSKVGRQGAHSCGGSTQTLPVGCWRPSLLPISVSGLLCTEGSVLVDTFQLYSRPDLSQYYHSTSGHRNLMSLPEGLLCQKYKRDLPELGL